MKHLLWLPDLPERAFRPEVGRMKLYGKSDAPAAPDYAGAAQVQSDSSKEVTRDQTWANRPDIKTPWGAQTWTNSSAIDPSTGQPVTKWSSNVSLTPAQQQALNSQQNIQQGRSDAAEDLLGQATGQFDKEIDYGSMPGRSGSIDAFGYNNKLRGVDGDTTAIRQQAQDASWNAQKPMLDDRRSDVENQLANQGLSRGSEAWNREMRGLDDSETRARLLSMDAGRQEAAQMFGQNVQSAGFNNQMVGQGLNQEMQAGGFNSANRQSAIAEEMQRRGYSLNELNALLTGQQVNMPQMPGVSQAGSAQGVNALGAAQGQYGAALDATNVNNANQAQTNGALASLASMAFMFSDIRLKEDIETVGLLPSGLRVVYYRYRGLPGRYIGVISQEVQRLFPEAVACDPSGFLKVDYSKVH